MNREILFRGKRIDNGEWVEGCHICTNSGTPNFCDDVLEVIPETVGQYTDLTDKNGKRIFEGDICKNSLGIVFTVEWDENNARFLGCTVQHERRIVYVGREPKVEVIGNIHDNPELLKGEADV